MYVSLQSGHLRDTIEVERSEDEISITCYPLKGANIYISFTLDEAEDLVTDLQEAILKESVENGDND